MFQCVQVVRLIPSVFFVGHRMPLANDMNIGRLIEVRILMLGMHIQLRRLHLPQLVQA